MLAVRVRVRVYVCLPHIIITEITIKGEVKLQATAENTPSVELKKQLQAGQACGPTNSPVTNSG